MHWIVNGLIIKNININNRVVKITFLIIISVKNEKQAKNSNERDIFRKCFLVLKII